jgi:hypothetical protein
MAKATKAELLARFGDKRKTFTKKSVTKTATKPAAKKK